MRRTITRWSILLLGWTLIAIGVAGFLLPILPGFPFFIVGLVILSSKSRWARSMLEQWKARHPDQYAMLSSWRSKMRRAFRRG